MFSANLNPSLGQRADIVAAAERWYGENGRQSSFNHIKYVFASIIDHIHFQSLYPDKLI